MFAEELDPAVELGEIKIPGASGFFGYCDQIVEGGEDGVLVVVEHVYGAFLNPVPMFLRPLAEVVPFGECTGAEPLGMAERFFSWQGKGPDAKRNGNRLLCWFPVFGFVAQRRPAVVFSGRLLIGNANADPHGLGPVAGNADFFILHEGVGKKVRCIAQPAIRVLAVRRVAQHIGVPLPVSGYLAGVDTRAAGSLQVGEGYPRSGDRLGWAHHDLGVFALVAGSFKPDLPGGASRHFALREELIQGMSGPVLYGHGHAPLNSHGTRVREDSRLFRGKIQCIRNYKGPFKGPGQASGVVFRALLLVGD